MHTNRCARFWEFESRNWTEAPRCDSRGGPVFSDLRFPGRWQRVCVNQGMRTLIADDQPGVLEALRLLLTNEGFQIEAAQSPAAVLDILRSGPFDVLLMDLNYTQDTTSGKEGLDLLARIQAIDDTLPIVAMTGWATVELAVEAMRRGVGDFVLKPWDNSGLLKTLQNQIEKGRLKRSEREELEKTRAMGQALLPHTIPRIPGFQIAAASQPAHALSGDYFDVLDLGNGKFALCIADVAGKGVPAALLMSNVQATVRALASESPAELADKLNRSIQRNTTPGRFVTFFYGVLDVGARSLVWTNAGHCPPLLIRASGEVYEFKAEDAVLGVFHEWQYRQVEIPVEAGDRLLIYTDGITEAANRSDEEFGEDRLAELGWLLRRCGAIEMCTAILKATGNFGQGRSQDDATLMVVAAE